MIEQAGRVSLMKAQGSGMIRLVEKASPPNGGEFRSGNVTAGSVGSVRYTYRVRDGLALDRYTPDLGEKLTVTLTVCNTGTRVGSEAVQPLRTQRSQHADPTGAGAEGLRQGDTATRSRSLAEESVRRAKVILCWLPMTDSVGSWEGIDRVPLA
jgi:hypothetical protein